MPEVEYCPKGSKRLIEARTATIHVKSKGRETISSPDTQGRMEFRVLKSSVEGILRSLEHTSISKIRIIGFAEAIDHIAKLDPTDYAMKRDQRSE